MALSLTLAKLRLSSKPHSLVAIFYFKVLLNNSICRVENTQQHLLLAKLLHNLEAPAVSSMASFIPSVPPPLASNTEKRIISNPMEVLVAFMVVCK